jgi:hypothetical protein
MNRCTATFSALAIVLGIVAAASSQPTSSPSPLPTAGEAAAAAPAPSTQSTPAMDAERAKIWNSPRMLRARAWVQEYCERSARITPTEAQQYMTELEHLSPVQMKLWLLKFDAEEEMIRQQQTAFNQARQGGVNAAIGMARQTDQAYAHINQDETTAAASEQKSINTQNQLGNEREMQNTQAQDNLMQSMYTQPGYFGGYPPYGYAPYAGAGAFHVHYHVHR